VVHDTLVDKSTVMMVPSATQVSGIGEGISRYVVSRAGANGPSWADGECCAAAGGYMKWTGLVTYGEAGSHVDTAGVRYPRQS
jgi:hypothetical protein